MKLKKLKTHLFFALANLPMSGWTRSRFIRWGGVQFDGKKVFIGKDVAFDTMYPQNIHIGNGVHITAGVNILTHYLNTDGGEMWRSGHVYIGDYTFIGTGTIISKDVHIGNHCIIGAGSVITKDIPDWEIWAGNPARFIKKKTPWVWETPSVYEASVSQE